LARENIDLLMGKAPPLARQAELLALAQQVQGVIGAHDLRAHHLGPQLSIHVHISVDRNLTVTVAHDIGERVRARLEAEEDVMACSIHIDPGDPVSSPVSDTVTSGAAISGAVTSD